MENLVTLKRSQVPTRLVGGVELTYQQMRVISLALHGILRKQIADYLGVSKHTIDSHCTRIYKLIGLNDSRQVLVWAFRNGFDLLGNHKGEYLFEGYAELPW